jgi:hypothetical protein
VGVAKERYHDPGNQQQYLIESIPYSEIATNLQTLPGREEARIDRTKLKEVLQSQRMIAAITRLRQTQNAQGASPSSETGSASTARREDELLQAQRANSRYALPAQVFEFRPKTKKIKAATSKGQIQARRDAVGKFCTRA